MATSNQLSKGNFMSKPNALSLGSLKVVYAREEDPENSIIIRNLYPMLKENKKAFGMVGAENMRSLFTSILLLLKTDFKELKPKLKFVRKEEIGELEKVIIEMSEIIHTTTQGFEACTDHEDYIGIRFAVNNDAYICLKLSLKAQHPYLILSNICSIQQVLQHDGMNIG